MMNLFVMLQFVLILLESEGLLVGLFAGLFAGLFSGLFAGLFSGLFAVWSKFPSSDSM